MFAIQICNCLQILLFFSLKISSDKPIILVDKTNIFIFFILHLLNFVPYSDYTGLD